ncbi:MAG TPA: glycosyltransferase family 61 protein [Ramlibacter sp.]|uniref:glycosyltransferase family 61 protein n=1 Tax=Ramlibacter sp. TaxID=1917967 RepID=UPI002C7F9BC0|nr:glycosyltransferase family 61 protein [Ramlibacter sp.]HVZ47090.1 glycosyltransferase family 61 protein [Ramlibacter sp.]
MELKFVGIEAWEAASNERIDVPEDRYTLTDGSGAKFSILPGLTLHRDLTILGTDWIPVRRDGTSALDQMTHRPESFIGKARNFEQRDGRFFVTAARRRRLDGSALLVGGHANYYHWLIDYVPRLLYAERHGEFLDSRRLLTNAQRTPAQREVLDLLGICADRLIEVEPDEAVTIAEVCVPNMLAASSVVHPLVPELLREALPPRDSRPGRRIYLSRQDAPTRQLVNEEALTQLLDRYGFERLVPGRMRVQDQIDACASAEAMVAVHGAAMANLVFCPPHARVIEIFTPGHAASYFLILAHVCGLAHQFSPASVVDRQAGRTDLHHHWEVDLAALESILRTIGSGYVAAR